MVMFWCDRMPLNAYMHDTLYLTYHTLYLLRISLQFRYGADTEPDTLEAVRYKGTEVLE